MNGSAGSQGNVERVNVEFLNNTWVVKNQGDSTVLFSSPDKRAAEKFAGEMADAHDINLKVFPKDQNSSSPVREADKMKIDVEKRDGRWVVRKAGEETNLFTSDDRDSAVSFAYSLDTGAGLDLHIDKD